MVVVAQLSEVAVSVLPGITYFVYDNCLGANTFLQSNSISANMTHLEITIPLSDPSVIAHTSLVTLTMYTTTKQQQFVVGAFPSTLENLFDESLDERGLIPPTITTIAFGSSYNLPLESLPPALKNLTFANGSVFNHPILPGQLPATLESLSFESHYRHKLEESVLPTSLTKLTLPKPYNYAFEPNTLPHSLQNLQLSHDFNQPLNHLPPNLTRLTPGVKFNQPITIGQLPNTLEHLSLRDSSFFSHPIDVSVLPPNLKTYALPPKYNYRIPKGGLPPTIEFLYLYTDQTFDSIGIPDDIPALRTVFAPFLKSKHPLPPWMVFYKSK
ncbi:hypothetical protein DFA_03986 [Cavenderia fasciculata]|uniref:FNIP repeat-containing protein n=1 Tax=Cavenderia fasciculata TaxID=261658 RepID=F4Q0Z1_CACFS|nr:uncharacterized protein DFA_03986 [Cavenderia fasciculata]EGG18492.1 hypothetical protein DFA_03986 [Cavenderia fasciculata]|eukprot:XP_004366396.1 hypothetical protein DFA_03986 [Cavenderia fasciculata]